MLQDDLYEQIITKGLEEELSRSDKLCQTAPIDTAEAVKVLSKYITQIAEQRLMHLHDNGGDLQDQIVLANRMIQMASPNDADPKKNPSTIAEQAEQLFAL